MPEGVFDGWLGDFIKATSAATETPPELAAAFSMAVLARALQKKIEVHPEPGWVEPVNLYFAPILPSASRKTPVMKRCIAPLIETEKELRLSAESQIARLQAERKARESQIKHLQDQAAKRAGGPDEDIISQICDLQANLPDVPASPRLFVQDITPEHLGTEMMRQGESLALFSDEGGIFETLGGRYNRGVPNLDLILQAHSGSSVRVDRGGRAAVILNEPALTVAVSPQPDVAIGLASQPGFAGRGLLARFLFAWPEDTIGTRTLTPCPTPPEVTQAYTRALKGLLELAVPENPRRLEFAPEAYGIWKSFHHSLERMSAPGGKFSTNSGKAMAGKMAGICARIAALLHVVRVGLAAASQIGVTETAQAIQLGEFHLEHGLYVLGQMGADPSLQIAQRLWQEIEAIGKTVVTEREVWMPTRNTVGFKRMADVEPGFQRLIDCGWIVEIQPSIRRGRPSTVYQVNPAMNSVMSFAHNAHPSRN